MENRKERKSNFELLRIIAMIFIIIFHCVFKSGYAVKVLNINNYLIKLFWLLGELGVNLFILISGYFMVKNNFSYKKIIYLLLEVIFYNSISAILASILGVESIFRIFYSPYSFLRMYIILYFLSPFINKLIKNITKMEYQKLLLICIITWSFLPTILGTMKNSTENLDFYCRMIWFVVMYLIGSYIRIYDIKILKQKKNTIILSTIMFILLSLSIIIIYIFKSYIPKLSNFELAYLWGPNNIVTLILSISLFELFANINIKSNKVINTLASTTLGIYMIHDGLLRKFIWVNIFHTKEMLSTNYAIVYIFMVTIIIFILGVIIDLIRQYLEKKLINPIINNINYAAYGKKIKSKIIQLSNKYI